MLLKAGYKFTSLVSHEKIVEQRKLDYYQALNKTQSSWKTEKENISDWLLFFLSVVKQQSQHAIKILKDDNTDYLLSEKQLTLWQWANNLEKQSFSRKEASEALNFPLRTVEQIIKKLLNMKKLQKVGEGRATRYNII
jgi:Fic family protein